MPAHLVHPFKFIENNQNILYLGIYFENMSIKFLWADFLLIFFIRKSEVRVLLYVYEQILLLLSMVRNTTPRTWILR